MQFQTLLGSPESTFWSSLASFKLNVQKLDNTPIPIVGYTPLSGRASGAQSRLCVAAESFDQTPSFAAGLIPSLGTLHNVNTIEDFKKTDKQHLLQALGEKIWNDITSGDALSDPRLLNPFYLLTFADLKKYQHYFWFCFPALVIESGLTSSDASKLSSIMNPDQLEQIGKHASPDVPAFVVSVNQDDSLGFYKLGDMLLIPHDTKEKYVFVIDPCSLPTNAGWLMRNVLVALSKKFGVTNLKVVSYRDIPYKAAEESRSVVFDVTLPNLKELDVCPRVVGWEKNSQGKMAPRMIDLGRQMDPKRLAEDAVDLNLKLMRWRLLPELQVEKVAGTKCLLLGSGTLGCNVARCLMGWGVRTITFVDYGKVSFSNPVRQSLFEFTDCCDGGKSKAIAAAEKLKAIFPDMKSTGHELCIPMPGHPVSEAESKKVSEDVTRLEELIATHDVVFLLTDTRESRWLPTLLSTKHKKMTINSALGFDSYMVMRHGRKSEAAQQRLGCYFCNDVVAPSDSLSDRTLDQQCTVTRPGLSMIASALAVELMVALLHHPLGADAACETPGSNPVSVLGLVPHQLRGNLASATMMPLTGYAFDKCTACSDVVVQEYSQNGFEFLRRAFDSPTFLEDLTGLTALKSVTMDVEWDDDDFEEEGSSGEARNNEADASNENDEDDFVM